MKIFVLENELNSKIVKYLGTKYIIEKDIIKLKSCRVLIIGLTKDTKLALQIVEIALQLGIEIICIKQPFCKEAFVCNLLIGEGAQYV